MNCKRIQDLLMTDYIDNELNSKLHQEVKLHIDACQKCKEFEEALQKSITVPLKEALKMQPPESVWQNIQKSIEQKPTSNPLADILRDVAGNIQNLFLSKRVVFAMATTLVMILVVTALTHISPNQNSLVRNGYKEEPGILSYISGDDENGDFYIADEGFDTAIEKYLL